MNDVVNKMKQDVQALMQGEKDGQVDNGQTNAGNDEQGNQQASEAGRDPQEVSSNSGNDSGNRSDSDNRGGNDDASNLSERDQFELEKALRSGWKPRDKFKGDEKRFIEPWQWNMNVAWLKKLDHAHNTIKQLEDGQRDFNKRIQNVMEVAKANAVAELEAKKKEAIDNSDHKEVARIDNEIRKTEEDYDIQPPEPQQQTRPEVQEWMDENPWFERNEAMTQEAIRIQQGQLSAMGVTDSPTSEQLNEALEITTEIMKKRHPQEFQRQPRYRAPELESDTPAPRKRKFGYNDLTEQEKIVLANIQRLPGGMSKEDYIQACADMRESQ